MVKTVNQLVGRCRQGGKEVGVVSGLKFMVSLNQKGKSEASKASIKKAIKVRTGSHVWQLSLSSEESSANKTSSY